MDKIIHQIWIGNAKIPFLVIDTIRKDFIKKYPKFKYVLWDEEMIENNKHTFKLYKYYKLCNTYSGMADLIRLDILYNYGGLYIDADTIYTANSINFMDYFETNKTIICCKDPTGGIFPNGFLGCTKNNKIIGQIVNDLLYDFNPYMPSCRNTGPSLLTKYLAKNLEEVHLFPTKLIYPTSWHNNKIGTLDTNYIEQIKSKYSSSLFFQIGFSTNGVKFDTDNEKITFYQCYNPSRKMPLKQFEAIDEYIITPHAKISLKVQIEKIMAQSKIQNAKKPIIYVDERCCDQIFDNCTTVEQLFNNCDKGIFIHLGSTKYSGSYDLNASISKYLSIFHDIKYMLIYTDPYNKKINPSHDLYALFEKVKIIEVNSKILNFYFVR